MASISASQIQFALSAAPDYAQGNFIVSACNGRAYELIRQWPDWPGTGVIIHGPENCGKTHLATVWAEQVRAAGKEAVFLEISDINAWLGSPDAPLCMVENIENISGEEEQRALFHLLNHLRNTGGFALLTSSAPAGAFPGVTLPDLRSRLVLCLAAEVERPDDGLLAVLLAKLFSDRQLKVDEKSIAFLVSRMERSFAAAHAWADGLDDAAMLEKRPVTIPLIKRLMEAT